MKTKKGIARTVGILLLLHLSIGLITPFVLLHPLTGQRSFLLTGAENAGQIRTAIFLLFVGSAMASAIAIACMPVFSRYSPGMTFWLLALGVAGFTLQAVDNGRILSLLSLSQEFARAGNAKTEVYQALALVAGPARKWSHYSYL